MSTIKAKIITAMRSKRSGREGVATRYFTAITGDQRLTQFTTVQHPESEACGAGRFPSFLRI